MTFDEWIAAAGLAVAGVAAVAGIIAAVYAIRADRAARSGSSAEHSRWLKTIQPRPRISVETKAPPDSEPETVSLQIANPGGAVTKGFVLVQLQRGYYGTGFNLAEHSVPLSWSSVPKIGQAPSATPGRVVLVVAKDVDGNWWDCGEEKVLEDFPEDGVSSAEFSRWINERIQGLQAEIEGAQAGSSELTS